MDKYDCSGWVTKANVLCSDGRTIMKDAFKHQDGTTVPVVYNHQYDSVHDVLGHALLENREEGVYGYVSFNNSESGLAAKELVRHGDVVAFSIYANKIKEKMSHVMHGTIREVSLVLAGANPKACIDNVIMHGEECEEAVIYHGESGIHIVETTIDDEENGTDNTEISHADSENEKKEADMEEKKEKKEKKETSEKTIGDVFETLNDEQKEAVFAILGKIADDNKSDNDNKKDNNTEGGSAVMKHNVFENEEKGTVISHSDFLNEVMNDGKRFGSLKESFLAHAENYGITNIGELFPENHNLNTPPEFVKRDTGWVAKVMSGVHHSPFSRIKSMFADIREDDARAKGYIKGNLKKEEVFSLLKRTTSPTTVYKKQKIDRDDTIDITGFDVLSWLKTEMRMMLDEEFARAYLIGDGRLSSSDEKIDENCIRPIAKDAELFTVRVSVDVANGATEDVKAKAFIKSVIKNRKKYKGSGEPTLFTTEDVLTDCLLLEDQMGHYLYDSAAKLAQVLRVKEIVTVPVMEGAVGPTNKPLMGLVVNLADYNVGADKGGDVNMFDDFDIDYNQMKYLIEARCSGALTKPFSALAIELNEAAS